MRTRSLLGLALLVTPLAYAADEASAPTEFPCASCPYIFGWQGWYELGGGTQSGATDWSSRSIGVGDSSAFLDLGADILRLDEDGTRWSLTAHGIGRDDRALNMRTGKAGQYLLAFDYWSKHWVAAEHASTPFNGVGTDTLALPPGWVRGDATTDLTALAAALHPVDISTQRERVSARAGWWSEHGWETTLEARHETKRGTDVMGGSFLTRSTLLPEPVDYTTESMIAGAAYGGHGWDVALHYLVSTFDDGNNALEWDNPFLGLHPTADLGRIALPPDNDFQQIGADARWRLDNGLRLEGGATLGTGKQDANLLPATANPGLTTALPRTTADAKVDTQLAFLRAAYPIAGVGLRAELRYDSRDVGTPIDSFTQVVTDTYVAAARSNVAYGYEKMRTRLDADWMLGEVRFSGRLQRLTTDRTGTAVAQTVEDGATLEAHGALIDQFDWGFEVGHDKRDASAYGTVGGIAPQNPLMHVYTYADMDRDRWAFTLGAAPATNLIVNLRIEQRHERFPDSALGLTARDDTGLGLDASLQLTEDIALAGFYQRQVLATDQGGSQGYGVADWIGTSQDATSALGFSLAWPYFSDKLGLRAEVSVTDTNGVLRIDYGPTEAFPDVDSKLTLLRLMADYRWDERIALRFGLRYEKLASSDWAVDGVAADTTSNLLSLGQFAPDYSLSLFEIGVRIGL